MPALNELTDEEREWLCDTVAQALSEDNTDELLELIEPRLREALEDYLPGWLNWLPFVDVVDMAVGAADNALPGLIRDPVLSFIGCPNVD